MKITRVYISFYFYKAKSRFTDFGLSFFNLKVAIINPIDITPIAKYAIL